MNSSQSPIRHALAIALLALPFSRPAPAQSADAAVGDQPNVLAHLWFVAFDSTLDPSQLPFDPRTVEGLDRHARDEHGRVPTWGIARQMKADELAVEAAGYRLAMRDGRLTTEPNGQSSPAAETPWEVLAAPKLVMAVGQKAQVTVGRPIAFLRHGDDGCLTVEHSEGATEGVSVGLTARRIGDDGIRFEHITLEVSRVIGRQPLEGVPLDVGAPIVDTRATELNITLDPGRIGIIPLPQGENEPAVLVFLTAEKVDADWQPEE